MILAAYMVTGFLVASIYAVGMLRGRRDRLHRLGLLIPLTVACIATPVQLFVGDTAARASPTTSRRSSPAWRCIQETGPTRTEYLGGICTDDGVKAAIEIPDLDSFLVGFSRDTVVTGLDDIPVDERPPATLCSTSPSTRWSGSGRRCCCSPSGWPGSGGGGATPTTRGSCGPSRSPGRRDRRARAGWIVTEVGRQPWIVWQQMRTSEAVTQAEGIWFAFAAVLILYTGLGPGRSWC